MYEDLVKRLNVFRLKEDEYQIIPVYVSEIIGEAADAIECLSKQFDNMNEANIALHGALPHWIPMTELLPEENAPCIVYNKDYGPMVGWRVDGERFRIPGSHFPDHPTHWMPLPEPPKEE